MAGILVLYLLGIEFHITLKGSMAKRNYPGCQIGVILLFISGMGASLAAVFDVSQPTGHGIAGLLGIPTIPIATLLISYHLGRKQGWLPFAGSLKLLAHSTWIMLVLMVVTMIVMISGFQNAGIELGPDSPIPSSVPDGVIALVGYVNRLLILSAILWLLYTARSMNSILKQKP